VSQRTSYKFESIYIESRTKLNLTVYQGWKIYAHVGKVAHNEFPEKKRKIKRWFNQEEWMFEDNDRTFIYNQNIDSPIEVSLLDKTTEEEKAMGLNNYGFVFNADFLVTEMTIIINNSVMKSYKRFRGRNRPIF